MVLLMVASALVSLSAQNSEIELERVFSKRFDRPIAMIPVIGYRGEFFVAQQGGEIFHVGRGKASLVMKLGAEVSRNHNEEGLLSMALSPRFISDGRLFLYYSASFPRRSLLSEVKLVRTKAGAWKPLRPMQELLRVKQPYGNHNGGTVLFGPDGFLYLGLGDGGSGGDPKGHGQNLATILGTIIRIDVSKSGAVFEFPGIHITSRRAGAGMMRHVDVKSMLQGRILHGVPITSM